MKTSLGSLAALTACGERRRGSVESEHQESEAPGARELEGRHLTPVRVASDLEVRSIVGLRPYRPSGFVVRREEWGQKSLIHNYGHGGGGISLSWGCAHLATELAGAVAGQPCAVIGGGVMGLSTARLLQLRGARVTLYTKALPPETTSNIAGGQWWPVSVYDYRRRTEAFARQFIEAAKFSHRYFQNLVGPRWGVRWIPNYYLSERAPQNGWMGGPGGVLHDLQVGFRDFGPDEHVFPSNYVRRFYSMLIEPATYLNTLMSEVLGAGGRLEIRDFSTTAEIERLPEKLIFNCTGLGAKALFSDAELIAARGQLSVLMPQPTVNYNLISDYFYMFPRTDGVILGGTFERGNEDLRPSPTSRERILQAHNRLFTEMARRISAASEL
ncbi:MAG: FAD-dependent oxidoreductase [Verrucomicrobiales bacterium]